MRHSKKAIKAEIRNKIAKEYQNKYKNKLATLYKSISKYCSENDQLKYLNEELTEKNQKQEAWINRLLDFCDLPENERKVVFDFFIASATERAQLERDWYCGRQFYRSLFGHHNLTSDTEPSELLFVERKRAQEMYPHYNNHNTFNRGVIYAFNTLFGDKCLPDKEPLKIDCAEDLKNMFKDEFPDKEEQAKPKFSKGQKVIVNGRFVSEIKDIDQKGYPNYPYIIPKENGKIGYFAESDLEPYTEEKNDMEEKELNLAELLKDWVGAKFYSPYLGTCRLNDIDNESDRPLELKNDNDEWVILPPSGHEHDGAVMVFPSRTLYEKYPLDAYSAWMEWAENRKPKRWKPSEGERVWYITRGLKVRSFINMKPRWNKEHQWITDGIQIFQTKALAEEASEGIRQYLENFHNRKEGEK